MIAIAAVGLSACQAAPKPAEPAAPATTGFAAIANQNAAPAPAETQSGGRAKGAAKAAVVGGAMGQKDINIVAANDITSADGELRTLAEVDTALSQVVGRVVSHDSFISRMR